MTDATAVFIAGATGYLGRHLIPALVARGHEVHALTRPASQGKLPSGCHVVLGDALDATSYQNTLPPGCHFVHLVGVAHPSPTKATQFLSVDLASVRESLRAAQHAGVSHFVYVSVAQRAPVMQAYVAARRAGEALVSSSGLPATILRPWYVLGPGHRWPVILRPLYWAAERWPATAPSARRLGLLTLAQMIGALVRAIECPCESGQAIIEVPGMRMPQTVRSPRPTWPEPWGRGNQM